MYNRPNYLIILICIILISLTYVLPIFAATFTAESTPTSVESGDSNEQINFAIIDYDNFLGYVFIILILMVLILIGGILRSRGRGPKKKERVGLHEPKEEPRPMGYMDKIPVRLPERPKEGPVTLIGGRRVQRYRDRIRLLIGFPRKKKYKKPDTKPYWRD